MPGTTEKSLTGSSLYPPLRYFYMSVKSTWAFSRLNNATSQPLLIQEVFQSIILMALHQTLPSTHFSLVLESPNVNTVHQMWPHQSLETEKQENCWSSVLWGVFLRFSWGFFVVFLLLPLLKKTVTAEEVRFRTTYTNMQDKEGNQKFLFTLFGSRGWEALKPNAYHQLLARGWWENGDASQCHGRSLTGAFWPRAELTSSPQGQSPSAWAWRQAQPSLKTKASKCSSLAHPFGALYHACFLQVSVMAITEGERKQRLYLHPLAETRKMYFSPWLWNTRNCKQTQMDACAFPKDRITHQTLFLWRKHISLSSSL